MSHSRKKRFLTHLTKVGFSLASVILLSGPASAIDTAETIAHAAGSEGGKEAVNAALTISKTKPALSLAAAITCCACIPVAGAGASPAMCIACGILIAKTLG